MLRSPVPIVSAINGHAFGMGAMVVLASDYAVMRDDRGYFCLPEADLKMRLQPAMNELVRSKLSGRVLRDVLLTGKRIAAQEALDSGIVDATCANSDLLNTAIALAEPMYKDRKTLSDLRADINQNILITHIYSSYIKNMNFI